MMLTEQEEQKIWTDLEQQHPPVISIDRLEKVLSVPPALGRGQLRFIELYPGLELKIYHEAYDDLVIEFPEAPHLVQFTVPLSGVVDSRGRDWLLTNSDQGYIGGSGIQSSHRVLTARSQPCTGVDIHMQPHLLNQFFAEPSGELPAELQPLVQGNDWQKVFLPKTSNAMRSLVQQIIDCPLVGITRRIYLQGKVFELIALQLEAALCDRKPPSEALLKPSVVARIHQAAEILRSRLEQPPTQTELAEQLGVSDRTLRRGFQAVFGTTILGYLTEQRLILAEHLLRHSPLSVAEVSHRIGYGNQGHFSAAFRRKFGMTPKQCALGKKSLKELSR